MFIKSSCKYSNFSKEIETIFIKINLNNQKLRLWELKMFFSINRGVYCSVCIFLNKWDFINKIQWRFHFSQAIYLVIRLIKNKILLWFLFFYLSCYFQSSSMVNGQQVNGLCRRFKNKKKVKITRVRKNLIPWFWWFGSSALIAICKTLQFFKF